MCDHFKRAKNWELVNYGIHFTVKWRLIGGIPLILPKLKNLNQDINQR